MIRQHEIKKHPSYDAIGYIFYWKGEIYRAVYNDRIEDVAALFECGLIDELQRENLFPQSEITEYTTDDCNMVIHHAKIPVQTLPNEWSFSMLKDAALTLLRVNKIAQKFNYQTVDAHGFNVIFHYGRPLFVDIGSFVKIENDFFCKKPGWRPFGEFQQFFYAPLKMWELGHGYFARNSLYGNRMSMSDYWRFRSQLIRFIPKKWLQKFDFFYYTYKAINTISSQEFKSLAFSTRLREAVGKFVLALAKKRLLWFSSVDLERLNRKVGKIGQNQNPSSWSACHQESMICQKYNCILSVINKYKINTVLDIGGNDGCIADMICAETNVKHVIFSDYDENRVNALYHRIKQKELNIVPVLMNFRISITDTRFEIIQKRLQSDMVLALSLSHHFVITRGTLRYIMERLQSFSKRYIILEFMPHMQMSPRSDSNSPVPSWYTIDLFREEFKKYFKLLEEHYVEKNRTLLIGELLSHYG